MNSELFGPVATIIAALIGAWAAIKVKKMDLGEESSQSPNLSPTQDKKQTPNWWWGIRGAAIGVGIALLGMGLIRTESPFSLVGSLISSPVSPTAIPVSPTPYLFYTGYVLNTITGKPIAGAEVKLDLQGKQLIEHTDAEGTYRFTLPTGIAQELSSRIWVEAEGYQGYNRNITISFSGNSLEDIRLVPSGDSSPVPPSSTHVPLSSTNTSIESLCREEEQIILSCRIASNDKILSICGSQDLASQEGYLQYRFGKSNDVELEYPKPESIEGSREAFFFARLIRPFVTSLSLSFSLDEHLFEIYDENNIESGEEQKRAGVRVTMPDGGYEDFVCGEPVMSNLASLEGIIPAAPWAEPESCLAKVLYDDQDGLNLREQATLNAPLIAVLGQDSFLTVYDSSSNADGVIWRQATIESGWIAERPINEPETRWLKAEDGPEIKVGQQVKVIYTGLDGLNLRRQPDLATESYNTIAKLKADTHLEVYEGPTHNAEHIWWKVSIKEGWIAEGEVGHPETKWIQIYQCFQDE